MPNINWLETELSRHFSLEDADTHIDIDHDGKIDDSERTDLNGDGQVNALEWKKFLDANEQALKNLGGFFKYYFEHGRAFDVDNPLHDILFVESEIASDAQVAGAYKAIENILRDAETRLDDDMTPEERMHVIYDSIERLIGYKIEDRDSLSGSIAAGGLDCDESSYIALSVGRQLGFPVETVGLVDHMFVRWDDPNGETFNMDYGDVVSDEDYIEEFDISKISLTHGVYLDTNDYEDFQGTLYGTRALAYIDAGEYDEALHDLNEAIGLDPEYMPLYFNRAQVKINLGDMEGALADLEEAVRLDPNSALAFYTLGWMRYTRGDLAGAIEDFERACKLDPSNSEARSNLRTLIQVRDAAE